MQTVAVVNCNRYGMSGTYTGIYMVADVVDYMVTLYLNPKWGGKVARDLFEV